ncbi:MAG: (Fe-S)-binding protein [Bacteroidales bacterium]|nr:(Fe-S)-binding protein [Bacteroidales bacterium]MDD4669934.1 (Fe-S)-binding protein [Bacteroidales bacterium]
MMRERFLSGYDSFVLPFMIGMAFILVYCIAGMIKVIMQLNKEDKIKLAKSLFYPANAFKNLRDIFADCIFHVKIWKRNKLLGYMHSSIAFGWLMLIVIGHIETWIYIPQRSGLLYYPVFFRYFMSVESYTLRGSFFFFLMDFFLLMVLSGIFLAIFKRFRSKILGMRRTTKLTLLDYIGLYSLWAIFPLRLISEGFTAGISGGSFLTIPVNWLFANFLSKPENFDYTWWAYSIVLGVFFIVLPFTRYMHIPAEILLIPMKNAGIKVRHPRKGMALAQLYSCSSCGLCIDACPMGTQKKNLKDSTVYLVRQIKRRNETRTREISDKCLMCGKCAAICPVGVAACDLRLAVREEQKCNIHGDYTYLKSVVPDLNKQNDRGEDKVLYYAGCMSSLTPVISRSVVKILDKAGVNYELMDKDGSICCGRPLLLAGKKEEAEALIAKNREIIHNSGATTLLVSCAICYKIFSEEYSLEGIKVIHYTEYFESLAKQGKITLTKGSSRYVYHDPCELGRGCGIYDAPREAISRIGELVPAEKEKKDSICCGGSIGSLTLSYTERGHITQYAVNNLIINTPDKIVTACPLCLKTFSKYSDVKVIDFAEALSQQME